MECSFGNSAIFVLRETRKILAQSTKVRKTLFLPEISPSKCSTGHAECLPDEHGDFLANQIFLRKTMKRSKVVSSSEESFFKMFLWWRGFCCWHPSWELLPKIWIFFIQIREKKTSFCFFRKQNFVTKCFSGHMECGVDNSAKEISSRNQQLFAYSLKVKKFCFLPKFFPRTAPLDT